MRLLSPITALLLVLPACATEAQQDCFPLDRDEVTPRRANAGEREQGIALQGRPQQGERDQGRPQQGEWDQGRPQQGEKDQGRKLQSESLALSELMGVRFELADGGGRVTLREGRLVADDGAANEASRTLEVVATTASGERVPMSLVRTTNPNGDERVAVVANGWVVCASGNDGMFVPGVWDESGAHVSQRDALTYACMDGVIAKCVDWGYAPWTVGADIHATCTRLARADYCGDGNSWTIDGTLVDVYDTHGVLVPTPGTDLTFEAAWNEDGAVCVAEARYDIVDEDGQSIVPECFAGLPRCTSLDQATVLGATMANASAHARIDACE